MPDTNTTTAVASASDVVLHSGAAAAAAAAPPPTTSSSEEIEIIRLHLLQLHFAICEFRTASIASIAASYESGTHCPVPGVIQRLLHTSSADVNAGNNTPLHTVVGSVDILRLLLLNNLF